MSSRLEPTLRALGLPPACVDLALGRNPVPAAGVTQPAPWYGCPPAPIPLWSEGLVYTGLWHHWFTSRPRSYVRVSVRADRSMTEVARTPAQFVSYATLLSIDAHDDLTDATVEFARRAGCAT